MAKATIAKNSKKVATKKAVDVKAKVPTTPTKTMAKSPRESPRKSPGSSGGGISAPQKILNYILTLEKTTGNPTVDRKMIATLSGVKSNTFPVTISGMKKKGLIEYSKDTMNLTDIGRAKANVTDMPDNSSTQEELKKKHKIGGKQAVMFDILLDGHEHDRAEIATKVGYTNKKSFAVALSNLKKTGLLEYDKTTIKLTDVCFPFGRPTADL